MQRVQKGGAERVMTWYNEWVGCPRRSGMRRKRGMGSLVWQIIWRTRML